jgi:hypothetical protein
MLRVRGGRVWEETKREEGDIRGGGRKKRNETKRNETVEMKSDSNERENDDETNFHH